MKKYLIAVDLDGTLLPDLNSLSDYAIKVFKKIKELGHTIVITTGRPHRSSDFVYNAFGLDTPIINYNGSLISNPHDSNLLIYSDEMNKDDILKIYNHEVGKYLVFFTEHDDTIYTNIDREDLYPLMHHSFKSTMVVGDLNDIIKINMHGCLILAKRGESESIKNYINTTFPKIHARVWAWGPYQEIVELYSMNSSKGSAIKMVADLLGFTKDEIIACGDSQNDFEFFKEAGITVSLSNADESIRKMSTYVFNVPVWDDGLPKFFNDFFDLGM